MKALEILNWSQGKTQNNHLDFLCGEDWDNLIKEAIKELEELENRSCNTCKSNFCSIKRILIREDEIDSNYFYCNDWENKA